MKRQENEPIKFKLHLAVQLDPVVGNQRHRNKSIVSKTQAGWRIWILQHQLQKKQNKTNKNAPKH